MSIFRQQDPPKHWYPITSLHGITTLKTMTNIPFQGHCTYSSRVTKSNISHTDKDVVQCWLYGSTICSYLLNTGFFYLCYDIIGNYIHFALFIYMQPVLPCIGRQRDNTEFWWGNLFGNVHLVGRP